MIDNIQAPVLSLSRFFHGAEKKLPCWLAGRFYPVDSDFFQLKSQGKIVECENPRREIKAQAGDWLAVLLQSKTKNRYEIFDYHVLSASNGQFQQTDFSYQRKGQVLQDWENFLTAVKDFFLSRGCVYVETPGLVECPGTEPHLQVFETSFQSGNKSKKKYLPTSPEISLKKLLCRIGRIFLK